LRQKKHPNALVERNTRQTLGFTFAACHNHCVNRPIAYQGFTCTTLGYSQLSFICWGPAFSVNPSSTHDSTSVLSSLSLRFISVPILRRHRLFIAGFYGVVTFW